MAIHNRPVRYGMILGLGAADPVSVLSQNGGRGRGTLGTRDLFDPGFAVWPLTHPTRPTRTPPALFVGNDDPVSNGAPAYEETWQTHVSVSLVGHASPRHRGAKTAKEADSKNLDLSKQRVQSVRDAIEHIIATDLADHQLRFVYDESHTTAENSDAVAIGTLAKGSQETLAEAGGDRTVVGEDYQRVDVRVDLTHLISGAAPSQHRDIVSESSATRNWAMKLGLTIDVHYYVGMSFSEIILKNLDTKKWANGVIVAGGAGANVFGVLTAMKSLEKIRKFLKAAEKGFTAGVSYSWGDYVEFRTAEPQKFSDFEGAEVRLTTFGVSVSVIGYSKTYITLHGFGSGAWSMDHSGVESGKLKAGGFVDFGYLRLSRYKGLDDDISRSQVVDVWEPYRSESTYTAFHQVKFKVGEHDVRKAPEALADLTRVIGRACQQYRAASG